MMNTGPMMPRGCSPAAPLLERAAPPRCDWRDRRPRSRSESAPSRIPPAVAPAVHIVRRESSPVACRPPSTAPARPTSMQGSRDASSDSCLVPKHQWMQCATIPYVGRSSTVFSVASGTSVGTWAAERVKKRWNCSRTFEARRASHEGVKGSHQGTNVRVELAVLDMPLLIAPLNAADVHLPPGADPAHGTSEREEREHEQPDELGNRGRQPRARPTDNNDDASNHSPDRGKSVEPESKKCLGRALGAKELREELVKGAVPEQDRDSCGSHEHPKRPQRVVAVRRR
eukprot:5942193-Prymnesium_polylepis.4